MYEEIPQFTKIKNNMKCIQLYRLIYALLNINYPILILYDNKPISSTALIPEISLPHLKSLFVYDVSLFQILHIVVCKYS